MIFAIDPGSEQSAYIMYDRGEIVQCGILDNHTMRLLLETERKNVDMYVIEDIACYGMPVGKDVFETVKWIGRFEQIIGDGDFVEMYRRDVKHHLCNSAKATDANIRQAAMDRFISTGGGKNPRIGTKKQPGPLYGIKADIWSALAIAITYDEKIGGVERRGDG